MITVIKSSQMKAIHRSTKWVRRLIFALRISNKSSASSKLLIKKIGGRSWLNRKEMLLIMICVMLMRIKMKRKARKMSFRCVKLSLISASLKDTVWLKGSQRARNAISSHVLKSFSTIIGDLMLRVISSTALVVSHSISSLTCPRLRSSSQAMASQVTIRLKC